MIHRFMPGQGDHCPNSVYRVLGRASLPHNDPKARSVQGVRVISSPALAAACK